MKKIEEEEKPDETASFWLIGVLLALAFGLMFAAIIFTSTRKAHAESLSGELQSSGMAYCALYAREATRIDIMHTAKVDPKASNSAYIEAMAVAVFKQCIRILPTLLPLPPDHRSLTTWEEDITRWVVSRQGIEPATGDNPDWVAQCAAEYRTWDPDTGTVVRKGSPERVKCPLIWDGEKWGVPENSSKQ